MLYQNIDDLFCFCCFGICFAICFGVGWIFCRFVSDLVLKTPFFTTPDAVFFDFMFF